MAKGTRRLIHQLFISFAVIAGGSSLGYDSFAIPTPGVRVTHITDENGLPQNSIKGLAFDKNGNLWLGTENGIVCYDGRHVKRHFSENPSLRIASIDKLNDNRILIRDDRSQLFWADQQIKDIRKDNSGLDNHYAIYWKKKGMNAQLADSLGAANFFRDDKIAGSTNNLYFYQKKLYFFSARHYLSVEVKKPITRMFMAGTYLVAIEGKPNRSYSIYFYGQRLWENNKITGDLPATECEDLLAGKFFTFNSDGHSFLLTNNSIYEISIYKQALHTRLVLSGLPAIENPSKGDYLKNQNVFAIGSMFTGLYIFEKTPFITVAAKTKNEPDLPGLPTSWHSFSAQVNLPDGSILGSNNTIISPEGKISKALNYKTWPYFFYMDRHKNIWNLKGNGFVATVINQQFEKLREFKLPELGYGFTETPDGGEWVSTYRNIFKVEQKELSEPLLPKELFQKDEITALFTFSNKQLWIGSRQGLFEFNVVKKSIRKISPPAMEYVRNIQRTPKGNLFIGTYGSGYYIFRNGRFIPLQVDANDYLKIAHTFVADTLGFLWISTNKGLFQVAEADLVALADGKTKDVYLHYYEKSYGFESNEFNGGSPSCGIKTKNGLISLASMNGLVWFDPLKVKPLLPDMPILATNWELDGKLLEDSKLKGTPLIPNQFKRLTLNVSSAYYGHPNNLQIKYRIVGFDSTWLPLSPSGRITISNAKFGNYRLEIRKMNGFGLSNFEIFSFSFRVEEPIYFKGWFIVLSVLLLFLFSSIIIIHEQNKLQKTNWQLEQKVKERTQFLADTIEVLDASNQHNEMLLSVLAHDIKGPIRFIGEISDYLTIHESTIAPANRLNFNKEIGKTAHSIFRMIGEFLTWTRLRGNNGTIQLEEVNVLAIADKVADLYQLNNNHNQIEVHVPANLNVFADPGLLEIVIRNLTDNACKYTRNGLVTLSAHFGLEKQVLIECSDTGRGINTEQINQILNENTPNYSNRNADGNSFKFGFMYIREMVARMNGNLEIESEIGIGTKVRICLPAIAINRQPINELIADRQIESL